MTSNTNQINANEVENALYFIQNSILGKESFEIRPSVLGTRMFDEFTNSNVEAEHASLKKKSLGISHTGTMTTLFKKSNMDASKKTKQRIQNQSADMSMTAIETKCFMSQYLVKKAFEAMVHFIELGQKCISKQIDESSWIVIYQRHKLVNGNHYLHFLPIIQRKRYVTVSEGT